jgi:hypothetical protein
MGKIKKFLCRIGWHIPKKEMCDFVDAVDGREVWKGHCSCGREFLHNITMKMETDRSLVNRGVKEIGEPRK